MKQMGVAIGRYAIVSVPGSSRLYRAWYDPRAGEVRRKTLGTSDIYAAKDALNRIVEHEQAEAGAFALCQIQRDPDECACRSSGKLDLADRCCKSRYEQAQAVIRAALARAPDSGTKGG